MVGATYILKDSFLIGLIIGYYIKIFLFVEWMLAKSFELYVIFMILHRYF